LEIFCIFIFDKNLVKVNKQIFILEISKQRKKERNRQRREEKINIKIDSK